VGFIKSSWDRQFTKYKDVKTEFVPGAPESIVDPVTGQEGLRPTIDKRETEMDVTELLWEGPRVDYIFPEDLVVIGEEHSSDPQTADTVIHRNRLTESYLYSMADQGVFDPKAVDKIIEAGRDSQYSESENIKQQRVENSGQTEADSSAPLDRYTILECYTKAPVDNTKINADIVMWVHPQSREILRATYLHRINKNGKRPIFNIDFFRRPGQPYAMGLAEILHPISVEMDAMHNMRIDFGLISMLPIGFYRPTSSINPKTIKLEPGSLIPVDNPQTDIAFPQWGNRFSWGYQEEASLHSWADRMTGISDLSLGVISGRQGAARTATGVQGLLGELSANLDVFLKRLNEGWGQFLEFLLDMLQQRLPSDFVFRVTKDSDLALNWIRLQDKSEIQGNYEIITAPNSATSNQQVSEQRSNEIMQNLMNPLYIQLGIVTPVQVFEILKNWMKVRGIKDIGRFIQQPAQMQRTFTPEEEANRILSGMDVPIDPAADHAGFISFVAELKKDDQILGQFRPEDVAALEVQMIKHQQMMQALRQLAAQQRNTQQVQTNKGLGPDVQQGGVPQPTGGTNG
jgi:hypothetical protein